MVTSAAMTIGRPPSASKETDMTITGTTTANVNFRTGPGTQHGVILTLAARATVELIQEQGDWLKVRAVGREGFVHRKFVLLQSATPTPAPMVEPPKPPTPPPPAPKPVTPAPRTSIGATLGEAPLEPPAEKKLRVNPKDPLLNRLAASIWNKYGSLLTALSGALGIEPAVAIAVFAVESGGNCFDPVTKKMLIRFENQVFFDQWGRHNQAIFDQHFTFNPTQRWLDHKWRPTPHEDWRPADRPDFHGAQDREWAVFEFASGLNGQAAKSSISMGAPQIMGFNCGLIGYASVGEMFDSFAASERNQIIGFFDFVRGPANDNRRVEALQAQDFTTFASFYNGKGQAVKYGGLIKTTFEAFGQMKTAAGI
jgi:hypothetical protein